MRTSTIDPAKNYDQVFCDLNEPLDLKKAQVEASRCHYCYDAPCIEACPTGIDIPGFIRKIGNGNIRGAALDILSANIMGGTCARACPVETLCQQACVREKAEEKPVQIGLLQRYATDEFFATGEQPFKRAASTGKKVAVVGAGPAGLSCAHRLARLGHEVTVFEAREKSGGLNEYGLAPYKMTKDFAQREVDFILDLGGIEIRHSQVLGRDFTVQALKKEYDAVFLGIGLGDTNRLGIDGEETNGVFDAARFIERIRQTRDLSRLPVGKHVIVIGGGNTAVDIAIQMKRLGAEFVTMIYRRGQESMSATEHEQELAQMSGVLIKTWMRPQAIHTSGGQISTMDFEYTKLDSSGKLVGTGEVLSFPADQVFKAIGQTLDQATKALAGLRIEGGKVAVGADFATSMAGVYAGGDCIDRGEDLTVTSVQQGKLAALAIHEKLTGAQVVARNAVNKELVHG